MPSSPPPSGSERPALKSPLLSDRPRLWGVAVSHYQVEGDDPCDWTEWEAAGRTKGGACGGAVGSWSRYEEDLALAAAAGANAFRFSVSWSRVEPARGTFDEAALARYRRLVDASSALGLEPVVTLFHYTHPAWFPRETPWTSPSSVEAFRRFAARVAVALGPAARVWTVLNEPLVFWLGGFLDGQIPPGLSDRAAAGRALEHLLRAHAAAAAEIRAARPGAVIGVAHNMMGFAPERPGHLVDRWATRAAHGFYNLELLRAMVEGRWSFLLPPFTRFRGRCDDLAGSIDFAGVNYYSRLHLRSPGKALLAGDFAYRDRTGRGLTDNGWEVVPEAMTPLLAEAARVTGLPLVVTENGLADADDTRRGTYLESHAAALEEAEAAGVAIAGYLHWSLLDNYEWLDGFGPRFGLYEVDRATLERRARPSVEVFRRLGARFLAR